MADVDKINIRGTDYDIKDTSARSGLSAKQNETLSSPVTVEGVNKTTVESAITAINSQSEKAIIDSPDGNTKYVKITLNYYKANNLLILNKYNGSIMICPHETSGKLSQAIALTRFVYGFEAIRMGTDSLETNLFVYLKLTGYNPFTVLLMQASVSETYTITNISLDDWNNFDADVPVNKVRYENAYHDVPYFVTNQQTVNLVNFPSGVKMKEFQYVFSGPLSENQIVNVADAKTTVLGLQSSDIVVGVSVWAFSGSSSDNPSILSFSSTATQAFLRVLSNQSTGLRVYGIVFYR